jgi:hypothetical protein
MPWSSQFNLNRLQKFLILVLFGTLLLSLLNIFLEIRNNRLERSIEDLREQKANLRAEYLSTISMGNLSNKAGQLEMQQISHVTAKKVSAKEAAKFKKTMAKKLAEDFKFYRRHKLLVLSGY